MAPAGISRLTPGERENREEDKQTGTRERCEVDESLRRHPSCLERDVFTPTNAKSEEIRGAIPL